MVCRRLCDVAAALSAAQRPAAPHSGQPEVLGLKALQPHQALNLRGVLGVLVEHAFNSRFATLKHIETNAELQIGLDDTLPTGMICHDMYDA